MDERKLTREQERDLRQLIETTRPLAEHIARAYRPHDHDDLAQEGMIALAAAAPAYDPQRGPWRRWAGQVIRIAIRQRLRDKTRRTHPTSLDALPEDQEPADESEGEAQSIVGDLVAHEWIDSALEELTPSERSVIGRRFGVDGHAGVLTLREVAAEEGVSYPMIAKIQVRALRKLRTALSVSREQAMRTSYDQIARRVHLEPRERWLLTQVTRCGQDPCTIAASGDMGIGECRATLRRIEDRIWDAIRSVGGTALQSMVRDAIDCLICVRNASMLRSGGSPHAGEITSGAVSSDDLIYAQIVDRLVG